jgi:MFS family permease
VTQTKAVYLVCFNVLFFGLGNLLWVPLSRIIGMRPVYLAATLVLIVSNIWSMKATSYGSLLAGRIVSGLAASAGDATVPAVVASMFQPSHRGRLLMVFHLCLTAGVFFSPIFSALFVQHATWNWSCGLIAIGGGVVLAIALVTLRETRPYRLNDKPSSLGRRFLMFLAPLVGNHAEKPGGFKLLVNILLLAIRPQILWASFTIGTFVGW